MIVEQFKDKAGVNNIIGWIGLPKSVFYYPKSNGKRGVKPSTHTPKTDGSVVCNTTVVTEIKGILGQEFCCYGYDNVTTELKAIGYLINKKKTYRIMDEEKLLFGKVIQTHGKRNFVKYRKIKANYPMEYLCLDIKYVWVAGEGRFYYLLTILDVYSRKAIEQIFQKSVKKKDVINLFRRIDLKYGIKGVIIRNDNGSQFIANDVKQFLRAMQAIQEFTHIATPEENSYIEAFHSIVQREVIDRCEFMSYYEAKTTLEAHRDWYNNRRNHRQIGMTPQRKWDQGMAFSSGKPQTARLDSDLSRASEGLDGAAALACTTLDKSESNAYLCLPEENMEVAKLHN